jgi:hypothetical protein
MKKTFVKNLIAVSNFFLLMISISAISILSSCKDDDEKVIPPPEGPMKPAVTQSPSFEILFYDALFEGHYGDYANQNDVAAISKTKLKFSIKNRKNSEVEYYVKIEKLEMSDDHFLV